MIPATKQFPKFTKGSPSSEFQQIINFCVNYMDGLLVNLMHMEIPEELSTHYDSISTLQKQLISRERTVRHTFQFQVEKFFADFKSSRRTRIRSHHQGDMLIHGLTGQKASRIHEIIETLSRKHQELHNTQLDNTGRRLKTLVHRSDEIKDDNPLSPIKICQAFLASIETFNISSQKNRDLFLLLDYNLQQQLGNFYNQIDLGLYNLGILAELTDIALFEAPVKKPDPHIEPPETIDTGEMPAAETITDTALEDEPATVDNDSELKQALSQLGQDVSAGTLEIAPLFDDFTRTVEALLEPEQLKTTRSLLYFYRNLLTNTRLYEPLRRQLSRLSAVLVELALIDQDFYKTEDHPVNNLITSIVDFELRYEHKGEILLVLSRLISDLLELKTPVTEDFQPLIEGYESFKTAEVKRLTKIKQARIKEAKLQQQLLEQVNDITSELVVDIETMQFFYEDWQLYLLHLAQTSGIDSVEFDQAMETSRLLVWALDETKRGQHPDYPETTFKSLLAAVDKGLNGLNYSADHRHRTRKQLIKEFKNANKQQQSFTTLSTVPKNQPIYKTPLLALNPSTSFPTKAGSKLDPDSIHIGDWMEIKTKNKKNFTRAKLKWKAADNNSFIFIDQRGHKVKQLNLDELQRNFAEGEIKLMKNTFTSSNLIV